MPGRRSSAEGTAAFQIRIFAMTLSAILVHAGVATGIAFALLTGLALA